MTKNPIKHAIEYHRRAIERVLEYSKPSPNTRKTDISKHNLTHLRKYGEFLNSEMDKVTTICLRLKTAKYFLDFLKEKKLEDSTKEDIEELIELIFCLFCLFVK